MKSLNGHAMRWGLYLGLVAGVLTIAAPLLGMVKVPFWWTSMVYITYFAGVYLCHRTYKAALSGEPFPYSRGVKLGFLQSFYASIIVMVFFTLMVLVIIPDYSERVVELALTELENNGITPDNPMYATAEATVRRMSSTTIQTFINGLSNLFLGLVVSLLVSIFTRSR